MYAMVDAGCKELFSTGFATRQADVRDTAQPNWKRGKKKDNKKKFFAGARASARPSKVVKLRWGARRFL